MAGDKADAIVATGAGILLSQDCGCLMNLGGTLARRAELSATGVGGAGPRVLHVAEFLWERISPAVENAPNPWAVKRAGR